MKDGLKMKPELAETVGQWLYLDCHCMVKFGGSGGSRLSYECEACGNKNLRFIHSLEHCEDHRQVDVGIECARVLLGVDEWEIPALAENEVKRKERWRVHYRTPGRCTATFENLIERGKL